MPKFIWGRREGGHEWREWRDAVYFPSLSISLFFLIHPDFPDG